MKWIEEIININNFQIKTLWNDGVIREIDLTNYLAEQTNPNASYTQLLDQTVFNNVKCDGTTLYWENLIDYQDIDGTTKKGDLDFSPELLFELANTSFKKVI